MRGRSYSYSPPARGHGRRDRSPSPRGRHGGRSRELPTTLLVRNLRRDCRPEDLRRPFGQFGPLKDIYLPRDYYSGEPRGFGFVQFVDPADAVEAKYQMDGQVLHGRELTVVFAEENRKKPTEMRARDRQSRGRGSDHRSPRRSRSRSPRSASPRERRREEKEGSYSRSPGYSRSRSRSPAENNSRRSPNEKSPPVSRSRSRSPSPIEDHHPPSKPSRRRERSESASQ